MLPKLGVGTDCMCGCCGYDCAGSGGAVAWLAAAEEAEWMEVTSWLSPKLATRGERMPTDRGRLSGDIRFGGGAPLTLLLLLMEGACWGSSSGVGLQPTALDVDAETGTAAAAVELYAGENKPMPDPAERAGGTEGTAKNDVPWLPAAAAAMLLSIQLAAAPG